SAGRRRRSGGRGRRPRRGRARGRRRGLVGMTPPSGSGWRACGSLLGAAARGGGSYRFAIGPFAAVAPTPRRSCPLSAGSGPVGRFAPFGGFPPATGRSPPVRLPVALELVADLVGRHLPAGHRGDRQQVPPVALGQHEDLPVGGRIDLEAP